MRALQFLIGGLVTLGCMWLACVLWFGRPMYSRLPTTLADLPWSQDAAHPAHVPTALLLKPCKERLETNTDLRDCLGKVGLKTGYDPDGRNWATFAAGLGFSPTTHRLTWRSDDGALPKQLDAHKE